jgi:hypothetical protein
VTKRWHSQARLGDIKHYEACTINSDIITTYPDIWKWNKTFPNYLLDIEPNKGMDTAMFVQIVAHFAHSADALTGSKQF